MHLLFLERHGIVLKILEDSKTPVMDKKVNPVQERGESRFRPAA